MGHKVRIRPYDQAFVVEGEEAILDAAIRAGIPVEYGCSSGSCGQCKARLLEGRVAPVRHQDYVFSARERAEGWILLCTNTAASDVVVEATSSDLSQPIPEQELTVKVRKEDRVDDGLVILQTQTPRTRRLRFRAGQYATVSIPGVGSLDLSIASCPCDDRHLEFHVRHLEGEPVSDFVFRELRPGMSLQIRAPAGDFVLDEAAQRPMILIAFDTGFAAIKSILEQATAQERERQIHLYWIACGHTGHYLDNLCRSWRDALDEFTYTPLTIPDDFRDVIRSDTRVRKVIDLALERIMRDHPDLDRFDIYISAPSVVVEEARRILEASGIDPGRMRFDRVRGNREAGCLVEPAAARGASGDPGAGR